MHPIDHLYRGYRLNPEALAVEDGARGLRYRELVERVDAVASGLQALLPKPGARIGVCAYNTIEHMIAVLAVYAAEHVWVALNPRNGKPELAAIADACALDAAIADEDCVELVTPSDAPLILGRTAGRSGSDRSIAGMAEAHKGARPVRSGRPLDQPQAIKFTGGSTGRPKGVVQSYRCINASIESYLAIFGFGAHDRNLCAAPLTHGSSHYVLPILSVGGSHLLVKTPEPAVLLDAFEHQQCSTAFMPPTMIYGLLAEAEKGVHDLSAVRHLHYGAAPMPIERIQETRGVFPRGLEVIYGQTEAPMLITAMTAAEFENESNLGSVGRATPLMRVEIRSAEGETLPPGEVGEIVCRGELVMNGYLEMPEETEKTIVDGWLHTGDAGYLDERGYLFIKDRLRDVIISGGFNVYPTDVEGAAAEHPAVAECIVFGVPDRKWGERVEAAVRLHPGAMLDEQEFRAFIRSRIGPVKTPKQIHVADELPQSAVGKVLRRLVRERYQPVEDSGGT